MFKKTVALSLLICVLSIFVGCGLIDLSSNNDNSGFQEEDGKETPKVYMNEILTNKKGIKFRVTEVQNRQKYDNGYGYGIETEYNFILVFIEIYNGDKTEYYVNPNNFYLLKEGGAKYTYDSRTYRFEDGMSSDYIQPQLKSSYVLLFETPTKTTIENYNLSCDAGFFDAFDDDYAKVIYLRKRPKDVEEN